MKAALSISSSTVARIERRIGHPLRWTSLMCGGLIALASGCGPTAGERAVAEATRFYHAGSFRNAARAIEPIASKPDENFALYNAILGSIYIADQRIDDAERVFLNAYEVMNSVGANAGGRSLGAVLIDEKMKVWKGEPFERAMANFYLGMTYYARADYDNARAAFENALFRLRDYDDGKDQRKSEETESNFALATIMLGRCWQRLGRDDLANPCFAKAAELQGYLSALANPELHRRSNLLLVVDYGYGPRRTSDFATSQLAFGPTPAMVGPIPQPRVFVNNRPYDLRGADVPTVDLLALAQDRRWQSIDTIRVTKSTIGTGLLGAGAVMGAKGALGSGARQRTDLMVAAGLLAAGALLKATSQTDLREWTTLPRTTFVLPLELPPGRHDITVEMPDGVRQIWLGLPVPDAGREQAYYMRLQRFVSGPFYWSPPSTTQPPTPTTR